MARHFHQSIFGRLAFACLGLALATPANAQFRWPWEPEIPRIQPSPPVQQQPWQPSRPVTPSPGAPAQPGTPGPPRREGTAPIERERRPPNIPTAPPARAQSEPIRNPIAEFAGLDKVTGRIISFDVRLDETVQFGALQVTPRACTTRPAAEEPFTTGFIQVDEVTLQNQIRQVFSGWMFAASPGLNAVEHPIYDVWLTSCKGTAIVLPRQGPAAGYEGAGPQDGDAPPAAATPPVQRRSGPGAPPPPTQRAPAPPSAPVQPSPAR
jgi:hypothetical protein